MKNLSELRTHFITAKQLAKCGDAATVRDAAKELYQIYIHCTEAYAEDISIKEKGLSLALSDKLEDVIRRMLVNGYDDYEVIAFLGLANKAPVAASASHVLSADAADAELPIDLAACLPDKPACVADEPIPDVPVFDADVGNWTACLLDGPADDVQPDAPKIDEPAAVKPVDVSRSPEPQRLDDFIGQVSIVERLREEIRAAEILGAKHIDNVLLLGNKGLGKSTLMELIAKELGVDFKLIDCTSFTSGARSEKNFHELMLRIYQDNRPVVLAFDEIHALPDKLQDRLLTLLQSRRYMYLESGVAHTLEMPAFTFIGATTDIDALREPLKDRCSNLTFVMSDYSRAALSQILSNKFTAMGMDATPAVIERCVNRFRCSLRDVNAIVQGLYTKTVLAGTHTVTPDMVEAYFALRGVDPIGLKPKELEILRLIRDDPKGAVSEDTIAGRAYLDVKVYKTVYEPFLFRLGLLTVTAKGRALTDKALEYLDTGFYDFGDGITVGDKPNPGVDNSIKE